MADVRRLKSGRKKKIKPEKQYSVLFGFHNVKFYTDETGFLKFKDSNVPGDLYEIVQEMTEATLFEQENYSNKKGWASPSAWADFINSDPDYNEWKFHEVKTSLKKKDIKND